MINFRYHVVSLTAVFLALIIGVAMGTTVVSKATVDGLRSNLARVEARSDSVTAKNRSLTTQLGWAKRADAGLTDQMLAATVGNSLEDVPVLVIASKGLDRTIIDRTLTALNAAGAKVDGTLLVNDRLSLTGENKARLAAALDVGVTSNVQRTMMTRLTAALDHAAASATGTEPTTSTSEPAPTTGPAPSVDPSAPTSAPANAEVPPTTVAPPPIEEPTVITALRTAGFLEYRPLDGQPANTPVLTQKSYRYVVISGAEPDVPNNAFLNPLIAGLVKRGPAALVAVSAASATDPEGSRGAFIDPLLALANVRGRISTVDDLETFAGLVAVVYALAETSSGRHGQYGLGNGTAAVVPAPIG